MDQQIQPPAPILVSNDEGVFQIGTDGTITQLVYGPVAFAIDDTQGGLLFQIDRGRDWEDFMGEPTPGFESTVWWVPQGESAARELLVPTPGVGHTLTLHDTLAVDDSFAVVYLRHEGEAPPFNGNMADTLRVYEHNSKEVTEIDWVRGWEWNLGDTSAGAGLIATTEYSHMGGGCRLFDSGGQPVSIAAYPSATDDCFDEFAECPVNCAISSTAHHVAYSVWSQEREGWTLEVSTMGSDGLVVQHFVAFEDWYPGALDVAGGSLLINRSNAESGAPLRAEVLDPTTPERSPTVGIAGEARFATALVDLGGAVLAPAVVTAPHFYRYGSDGLIRVSEGAITRLAEEPVAKVWDDHMGGVLYRTDDWRIHWLPSGATEPTPFSDVVPHDPHERVLSQLFTGVLDGHPTVFYDWWRSSDETADEDSVMTCDELQLVSRNLVTGAVAAHMCLPLEDAWFGIESIGGDRFVGDFGVASGASGTSIELRFWDQEGNPLNVSHNPIPTSCAPCELDALLSPDGTLLAHRHRPDAKWPLDQWDPVPAEEWWESSRVIPGQAVVLDLNSGAVLWSIEVAPDTRLSDFDGRYVVVTTIEYRSSNPVVSTIHDTWGIEDPIVVSGHVTLVREPVAAAT